MDSDHALPVRISISLLAPRQSLSYGTQSTAVEDSLRCLYRRVTWARCGLRIALPVSCIDGRRVPCGVSCDSVHPMRGRKAYRSIHRACCQQSPADVSLHGPGSMFLCSGCGTRRNGKVSVVGVALVSLSPYICCQFVLYASDAGLWWYSYITMCLRPAICRLIRLLARNCL